MIQLELASATDVIARDFELEGRVAIAKAIGDAATTGIGAVANAFNYAELANENRELSSNAKDVRRLRTTRSLEHFIRLSRRFMYDATDASVDKFVRPTQREYIHVDKTVDDPGMRLISHIQGPRGALHAFDNNEVAERVEHPFHIGAYTISRNSVIRRKLLVVNLGMGPTNFLQGVDFQDRPLRLLGV